MFDRDARLRDTAPHAQAKAVIALVGARVLSRRKGAGFSRQELSDRSGVSTRYLAQLEGGEGNISIGLLTHIAHALETSVVALVSDDDPQRSENAHLLSLYAQADPAVRARVVQMLDPAHDQSAKAQRICLIGLRGAGKSTLGALLANDIDMPFIELNAQIEARIGVPVGEIIALYGDDGFREIEAEVLDRLIAEHRRLVLAVAGGIVSQPATFERVLTQFHTVWIKAQPAEHMDRVRAQGDLRPMAGNPQAMAQLRHILKTRAVDYARATYQLDTSGQTIQTSRADLKTLLLSHNVAG